MAALIACLRLDSAIAQELIYTIREELPENVPIGNIPKDLNIFTSMLPQGPAQPCSVDWFLKLGMPLGESIQ